MTKPKLYRYSSYVYREGSPDTNFTATPLDVHVILNSYTITSETPIGYWISAYGARKFVLRTGAIRFAYPTIIEAADAFQSRARAQQISLLRKVSILKCCLAAYYNSELPTYATHIKE